jgi:NADH-quinone oxidoreductase subunit L
MVWYGPFFGSHDRVAQWFHMPHAAAGAHEAGADPADHAAAPAETAEPGAPAAPEEAHAAAAPDAGVNTAVPAPVGGAIYMHPDNHVMDEAHHAPAWVKASPFVAMLVGLFTAWMFYIRNPRLPAALAGVQQPLYRFLLNKWYFDEAYDWLFVRTARWIGRALWRSGDGRVIDGAINGVAMGIIPQLTRGAARVQSGFLFHYALAMVIGIVAMLVWVTMRGAH